jgi:hypothetical protein
MLAFLSRSGLQPTVSGLRCTTAHASGTTSGAPDMAALDISAVNGTPVAGHQGPGTLTDLTIRTLLSLPGEFLPQRIVSLMRYPGASNTHATPQSWSHIHVAFRPGSAPVMLNPAAPGAAAKGGAAQLARTAAPAVSPLLMGNDLTPAQWDQLIKRIAALPTPTVKVKPSSAAIEDPKHP